jgi:hypothetical protein
MNRAKKVENADRSSCGPTGIKSHLTNLSSDERLAILRPLIKRLESNRNFGHLTARHREQRLAKIRAEIYKLTKNESASFCNCKQITTIAGQTPEEFEAEITLACPIHGIRRLGVIVRLGTLPPDEADLRIMELMKKSLSKLTGIRRSV